MRTTTRTAIVGLVVAVLPACAQTMAVGGSATASRASRAAAGGCSSDATVYGQVLQRGGPPGTPQNLSYRDARTVAAYKNVNGTGHPTAEVRSTAHSEYRLQVAAGTYFLFANGANGHHINNGVHVQLGTCADKHANIYVYVP